MAYPDEIDTSGDYLLWTNTITVHYVSKDQEKPPAGTGIEITNVLRTFIRKDRLRADSLLAKMDRTFRFAKAMLKGIVPKQDDIIIDDQGIRWKAEIVEVVSYGNEYRVHVNKSAKQNVPVG